MSQGDIRPKHEVPYARQIPYESICTCKGCNHGLARDCAKSACRCCKKDDHSMVMDRMEGFMPTDREERSYGK